MHKINIRTVVITGILLSLSLIIGTVEHTLPPIIPFLPFIRIGFSNIVILFTLITVGVTPAIIICILKSVLVPLFVGNPMMILYSLPASIMSLLIAINLTFLFSLSLPTVSMLSSIMHNIAQIFVCFLIVKSKAVFSYLPYLLFVASLAGIVTGIITYYLIKFIPKNVIISRDNKRM